MANGKQRDSFLTDIVNHALPTFSSVADEQIRRISGLSDTHQVDDLRNEGRGVDDGHQTRVCGSMVQSALDLPRRP